MRYIDQQKYINVCNNVGSVLLIFLDFCAVFFALLVFVLCLVPNVARVPGFSLRFSLTFHAFMQIRTIFISYIIHTRREGDTVYTISANIYRSYMHSIMCIEYFYLTGLSSYSNLSSLQVRR